LKLSLRLAKRLYVTALIRAARRAAYPPRLSQDGRREEAPSAAGPRAAGVPPRAAAFCGGDRSRGDELIPRDADPLRRLDVEAAPALDNVSGTSKRGVFFLAGMQCCGGSKLELRRLVFAKAKFFDRER
jgi:hypothetical protein